MTILFNEGKINWKYILIGIILLFFVAFVFIFLSSLTGAGNKSPNVAIDNEGNLHIVWVSGNESQYEQNLYYKKIDTEGKTLINTTKLGRIERILDGPEIVTDSKNNVHIFTGIEVAEESKQKMIIQHLIVENGNVSFKREIKRGDETRKPAVAVDKEDNVYFLYSVWSAIKDDAGIVKDWDIGYYFEKLNSEGEILTGPVKIEGFTFPKADVVAIPPYDKKIVIHNDKLYFAIGLTYYGKNPKEIKIDHRYKYAEMNKDGKLLRLRDSSINYYINSYFGKKEPSAVLTDDSSRLCFDNNCTVDSNNNVYYFYSLKNRGERKCYLQYKKFDQSGEAVGEGRITKFANGPFYWIFDPVIFNLRSYIDKNNNSNIIYYMNDGFNNFSVFYSKIDTEGKILIGRLKIR